MLRDNREWKRTHVVPFLAIRSIRANSVLALACGHSLRAAVLGREFTVKKSHVNNGWKRDRRRTTTVGGYLIARLEEQGLKHIFGIPGDYILAFYDMLEKSDIDVVGTCTEAGAGFAADAYARVSGLGALCVTYCVGGLNALNPVAGAYAEKSPLVVISGAPGIGERGKRRLLHHRIRDYDSQRNIFREVTVAAVVLDDADRAPEVIDRALLACHRHKRPVYIELPRDMVTRPCAPPAGPLKPSPAKSDAGALREALDEACGMLEAARQAVVLAGVEIHRFGLQRKLVRLVEKSGYPVAATLLSKSVISELHPQYLGVYEGAMCPERVRKAVERSDCLLVLGAFLTDIDLGIYTARLDASRTINAASEKVTIKHHIYEGVTLADFLSGITRRIQTGRPPRRKARGMPGTFAVDRRSPLTVRRFFGRLDQLLDDRSVVIADIGDSLFGAADLTIHRGTEFLSPAYYTSMGFAVPAALGVQVRRPNLRPLVLVGDGAFQMTGQELSAIVRRGLNPIIFVLNNRGYTTERFMKDGPYNDILNWAYHLWPKVLGSGWGTEVSTEGELEDALVQALGNTRSFSIINIHLAPGDHSEALERLARRLGERLGGTEKSSVARAGDRGHRA